MLQEQNTGKAHTLMHTSQIVIGIKRFQCELRRAIIHNEVCLSVVYQFGLAL
jgi:hypothetical protein